MNSWQATVAECVQDSGIRERGKRTTYPFWEYQTDTHSRNNRYTNNSKISSPVLIG
ncbi:hypothetical protein [Photorhabdus aegyptia]|uniref:hypothetical protein n=1 Tax=Photorhabdus aegyptia TaxID=2805098 RepID=UPI00136397E7|nr:hypothetical protein [Photorhabdus aegyptia]